MRLIATLVVLLALSSIAEARLFERMRARRAGGGCGASAASVQMMSGGGGCANGSCTLRR